MKTWTRPSEASAQPIPVTSQCAHAADEDDGEALAEMKGAVDFICKLGAVGKYNRGVSRRHHESLEEFGRGI